MQKHGSRRNKHHSFISQIITSVYSFIVKSKYLGAVIWNNLSVGFKSMFSRIKLLHRKTVFYLMLPPIDEFINDSLSASYKHC